MNANPHPGPPREDGGPSPAPSEPAPLVSGRMSKVVLAIALVTAVSGYFMGLQQLKAIPDAPRPASPGAAGKSAAADPASPAPGRPVPRIVEYRRLGEGSLKPNAGWKSSLATLRSSNAIPAPPAVTKMPGGGLSGMPPVIAMVASDAARSEAVLARAARRAFEGAPPVIPHPVDAITPASCRTCHLTGLAVRGVVAPKMSHGEMGSCTQCHVPQGGPGLVSRQELSQPFAGNAFEGLRSAGKGARAWPGAPPTIPHTLWMRQDCASCHGPTGLAGLRTSHPERAACQQCHVPDGQVDLPPWMRADASGGSGAAGRDLPGLYATH